MDAGGTLIIREAATEAEVRRCWPVMVQLRPGVAEAEFPSRVRRQQAQGYRLAFLEEDGAVRAVAGFRILDMLSRDRFLYLDDFVTDAACRGRGHGRALWAWLVALARAEGCRRLDLDSGVERADTHRFYFRSGLRISAFHFAGDL